MPYDSAGRKAMVRICQAHGQGKSASSSSINSFSSRQLSKQSDEGVQPARLRQRQAGEKVSRRDKRRWYEVLEGESGHWRRTSIPESVKDRESALESNDEIEKTQEKNTRENPERMQEDEVDNDDSEELLLSFQVLVIEKNNLRGMGRERKTYLGAMISAWFAAGVVTVLNIVLLFCLCAMLLRTSLRAPLVL